MQFLLTLCLCLLSCEARFKLRGNTDVIYDADRFEREKHIQPHKIEHVETHIVNSTPHKEFHAGLAIFTIHVVRFENVCEQEIEESILEDTHAITRNIQKRLEKVFPDGAIVYSQPNADAETYGIVWG